MAADTVSARYHSQTVLNRRSGLLLAALAAGACGSGQVPGTSPPDATYAGSDSCRACHADIHARWERTLMARVLQDPAEPGVVLGDFASDDPLLTFGLDDVVFTYGSKWKQRYYGRAGDEYFMLPAQWDVQNEQWRRYLPQRGGDWWTEYYPETPEARPTGPLCDGCHSVNYDIAAGAPTEWNVGCEACHGPGSAHNEDESAASIVNPARLDPIRADDICIQCHSQGQPRENPIGDRYYDWPVGFRPGERLAEVWALDPPHPGEETFTHWPDGSAHKNRMQGNDYVQSQMYVKGVTCYGCHDVHGTEHAADLRAPGNDICLECHGPQLQAGPRGSLAYHTQHEPDGEGSACIACHMPSIARTVGDINVRSHTFRFISPALTDSHGIPNPCTTCHDDQTTAWALEALASWPQVSPWRTTQ